MAETNGKSGKPWGTPAEVSIREMRSLGRRGGVKTEFYEDVRKRLEQTGHDRAVQYPFESEQEAAIFRAYVVHAWNREHGPGSLMTAVRANGRGAYATFARKNGKGA